VARCLTCHRTPVTHTRSVSLQRTCAVYQSKCVANSDENNVFVNPGAPIYNVIGMAGAVRGVLGPVAWTLASPSPV